MNTQGIEPAKTALSTDNGVHSNKINLLILHDQVDCLERFYVLFRDDYNVKTFAKNEDALHFLAKHSVDLILLSAELPNHTSDDFCRQVKRLPRAQHTPFILITDKPNTQAEEKSLMMGARDYIYSGTTKNIIYNRVANHLKAIAHQKQLETISTTDALTGLTNRFQLVDKLNHEWNAAIRGKYSVSFMIIKLSQFKLYDEQFGHLYGDKCIVTVSQTLTNIKKRNSDIVARFNHDEFALLMPHSSNEGAKLIAEKIKSTVNDLSIRHASLAKHKIMTVDLGIATHKPTFEDREYTSPQDLIEKAELNLVRTQNLG